MDLFNKVAYERNQKALARYKTNYTYICNRDNFNRNFDKIMSLPQWVVDTETTGLDFLTDEVTLLQIGDNKVQYVVDTRFVEIGRLNEKFEDEKHTKILVNALFDYLMLRGSKNIVMEGIYDTYIAEKILTSGYQKRGFGMEATALKYLGIHIDKEMQKSFIGHKGPFSNKQLEYAALDNVYPWFILQKQMKLLTQWKLVDTFILECNAIPAFGDSAFFGMMLDKEKWEKNIRDAQALSNMAVDDFSKLSAKYAGEDLFGDSTINVNSPKQIQEYLVRRFGENDLRDRDGKVGTGIEILDNLVKKHGTEATKDIQAVIKIRGYEKKIGTYGYTYLDHVHPKTDRFHPKVEQLGTETGRPAGKKPNMLNIPSEKNYRDPWICGEGRAILNDDYAAAELRIMASLSGDPVMCEGFNSGKDFHTYTAAQFVADQEEWSRVVVYSEEDGKHVYGDYILNESGDRISNPYYGKLVPYERVLKHMRTVAKTINFGLAYGMGPAALAARLNIAIELAREYIMQYNSTFKVLVDWLEKQREKALIRRACTYEDTQVALKTKTQVVNTLGYSETPSGRKRFYRIPITPEEVKHASSFSKKYDKVAKKYYWVSSSRGITLSYDPGDSWDKEMIRLAKSGDKVAKKIRTYYSKVASIKREGGNAPIQGTNADMTKVAMYEYRKFIRQYEKEHNNGEYLAHIMLQVYDEILAEVPESLSKMFGDKLTECMIKAGERYIRKVPVSADCVIGKSWIH